MNTGIIYRKEKNMDRRIIGPSRPAKPEGEDQKKKQMSM